MLPSFLFFIILHYSFLHILTYITRYKEKNFLDEEEWRVTPEKQQK